MEPAELEATWQEYLADKSREDLRDRLAGHYFDWAWRKAFFLAKELAIIDHEDAAAVAVAHLWQVGLDRFEAGNNFTHWAYLCLRRKLIDCRRKEQARTKMGCQVDSLEWAECEESPDCGGLGWLEIFKILDRRAMRVFFLRFGRGLSIRDTARRLHIGRSTVIVHTKRAREILRKRLSAAKK